MLRLKDVRPKVEYWKSKVGLHGWDISVSVVNKDKLAKIIEKNDGKTIDKDDVVYGAVVEQFPAEQAASIVFLDKSDEDFGMQLNLDTLILHELIHIVVGERFDRLPKAAKISPRTHELEEFLCDYFARRIYKITLEGENNGDTSY